VSSFWVQGSIHNAQKPSAKTEPNDGLCPQLGSWATGSLSCDGGARAPRSYPVRPSPISTFETRVRVLQLPSLLPGATSVTRTARHSTSRTATPLGPMCLQGSAWERRVFILRSFYSLSTVSLLRGVASKAYRVPRLASTSRSDERRCSTTVYPTGPLTCGFSTHHPNGRPSATDP